jgi:hypothetical protein
VGSQLLMLLHHQDHSGSHSLVCPTFLRELVRDSLDALLQVADELLLSLASTGSTQAVVLALGKETVIVDRVGALDASLGSRVLGAVLCVEGLGMTLLFAAFGERRKTHFRVSLDVLGGR